MFTLVAMMALLLLRPNVTAAQETARIPRVGILIREMDRPQSQAIKGLRDELAQLGYRERKNIVLEMQNASSDPGVLKSAAAQLVGQNVDLIFTVGTRATQAAQSVTSKVPIVFCHPTDPVALGLVKSMTRPGGNSTGVAAFAAEMTEKRLEIFKEVASNIQRVIIYYDSNNPFFEEKFAQKWGGRLGVKVVEQAIKGPEELKSSMDRIQKGAGDALFLIPDHIVDSKLDYILDLARQKSLPTMSYDESGVIKGALAGYGPSYFHMGRQSARLMVMIIQGQKPESLPIARASKFDLVVNYRTATLMGLSLPSELLKRADRVIR